MVEDKVYGTVWFTTSNSTIGIVTMNNGYEDKAYIGRGFGKDEVEDTEMILKFGAKFPFDMAIKLTGGKLPFKTEKKK